MRCKKHYTDLSSIVGVCASCLRERLLSLIAAQERAQAQVQSLDGKHCNLDTNPVFPRSVSPYINRRKSDYSAGAAAWPQNNRRKDQYPCPPAAPRHRHSLSDQLFYRTPQVGPTTRGYNTVGHSNKKRSFIRFLSFPKFFRSRNRNSANSVSEPSVSDSTFPEPRGGGNATSSTSSPSWFSSIIHRGRHRRKQPFYVNESSVTAAGGVVQGQHCRDRGMSPVRASDGAGGGEDELYDASSGYDSTESWKQTPWRTPAHPPFRRGGGGGGHGRNFSGLTFCLSPLVRASPNRQWNQKGLPPDGVLSGEIRAPVKPHLSNTKSFCANRSRKLADFGRFNPNR